MIVDWLLACFASGLLIFIWDQMGLGADDLAATVLIYITIRLVRMENEQQVET